jgi:integrase
LSSTTIPVSGFTPPLTFLRYLHSQAIIKRDLACTLVSSRRYAFEGIPPVLRAEHINALLRATRKDRTPKGLRDYAILLLLSTYGLWAGEVTGLQLNDIDWRKDQLRIRHSKTGGETFLPLLAPVGEAILGCLQKGRPAMSARAVFLRARAPFEPLRAGSSLYHLVEHRLQRAGIRLERKHGPHAFRHALAVSLLDAGVSLTIRALLLQVIRKAGLKPFPGRVGPRIHDLRHAFVVNRILAWYREGVNAQARLPYLATYLGHKDIHSTLVYITVTEELMQQAAERFRSYGAHVLHSAVGGNPCQ